MTLAPPSTTPPSPVSSSPASCSPASSSPASSSPVASSPVSSTTRSSIILPPRLVVTDLDGTLLDASGGRVSGRNADALRRVEEAGARVVIATGRPIWWLSPVIEAGFTGIAVCMNGAVVYDIGAGEVVAASPMAPSAMRSFVAGLEGQTGGFGLAVERLGTSIAECWSEAHYDHPWGIGQFQITDRASLLAEPAAKLLVSGPGDSRSLAVAARAAQVDEVAITYSSDAGLLEVAAAGVSKGAALARLAVAWGIEPAEVVAFGDMPNDLEMLHWAGHGVAMANAHPDLLAIASEVAPHHDEDGVAAVLERWF